MTAGATYDVVVPTVGRRSLEALLHVLEAQKTPRRGRIVLADDRTGAPYALGFGAHANDVVMVRSGGRGPAAARNTAFAATTAPWVVFLDDDVVPTATWARDLERDLDRATDDVAAVQGRIVVPLPTERRPTDWERNVAGLEHARWATADMAVRRRALRAVGGFDERFPRAYREDADLGLRIVATGARIARGTRVVEHPVRPAPWHVSIGKQRGNADDALMRALHGPDWRRHAGAPAGRRRVHVATTASGLLALLATTTGRRRIALAAASVWAALTAEFTVRRLLPGPRRAKEIATMLATSIAIPPIATACWCRGRWHARRLAPGAPVAAVLFDRDGTLVVDVPYNGDPGAVRPAPGAPAAVARVRAAGVPMAVITNQSGIARGLLRVEEVEAVNARVDELLGPFGAFCVCPHADEHGCGCRKPAAGLVHEAAARLGVDPRRCVVIGDIGADVEAARAAGALAVLVPTPATRAEEVAAAPIVAPDLGTAVDIALRTRVGRR